MYGEAPRFKYHPVQSLIMAIIMLRLLAISKLINLTKPNYLKISTGVSHSSMNVNGKLV